MFIRFFWFIRRLFFTKLSEILKLCSDTRSLILCQLSGEDSDISIVIG